MAGASTAIVPASEMDEAMSDGDVAAPCALPPGAEAYGPALDPETGIFVEEIADHEMPERLEHHTTAEIRLRILRFELAGDAFEIALSVSLSTTDSSPVGSTVAWKTLSWSAPATRSYQHCLGVCFPLMPAR